MGEAVAKPAQVIHRQRLLRMSSRDTLAVAAAATGGPGPEPTAPERPPGFGQRLTLRHQIGEVCPTRCADRHWETEWSELPLPLKPQRPARVETGAPSPGGNLFQVMNPKTTAAPLTRMAAFFLRDGVAPCLGCRRSRDGSRGTARKPKRPEGQIPLLLITLACHPHFPRHALRRLYLSRFRRVGWEA
jgi:hypothetical protein